VDNASWQYAGDRAGFHDILSGFLRDGPPHLISVLDRLTPPVLVRVFLKDQASCSRRSVSPSAPRSSPSLESGLWLLVFCVSYPNRFKTLNDMI